MKQDYNFWIEYGLVAGFELLEDKVRNAFTNEGKDDYMPVRFVFLNDGVKGFTGSGYTFSLAVNDKYTNIPRDQVYENLGYTFYIDNFGVKEIGYSIYEKNNGLDTQKEIVRFTDINKFNLGAINDTLRGVLINVYGDKYAKVLVPHLAQESENSAKFCKDRERSVTKALISRAYGDGIGGVLAEVPENTNDKNS